MKLLLDTHALIWFAVGDEKLPRRARTQIASRDNDVLVSAASAWEIATKFRKGRLAQAEYLVRNWTLIVAELGFAELPISADHALRSGLLPLDNPDPFDRVLLAQALTESAVVVSNERTWEAAGAVRLWD